MTTMTHTDTVRQLIDQLAPRCDMTIVWERVRQREEPCPAPARWIGTLADLNRGSVYKFALCTEHCDDLRRHLDNCPSCAQRVTFTSEPLQ